MEIEWSLELQAMNLAYLWKAIEESLLFKEQGTRYLVGIEENKHKKWTLTGSLPAGASANKLPCVLSERRNLCVS